MNNEKPLTEEEITLFVDFMEEDNGVSCGTDNCLKSAGWFHRCLNCGDIRFICESHNLLAMAGWRWVNQQEDAQMICPECNFKAKPVDNWRARSLEEK
jgi:hypothetical protein